jgi:hypothetical protein
MYNNPVPTSALAEEGTVMQVDGIRHFCIVRTMKGQTLPSVQWLLPVGGSGRGGDRISPSIGDRVMLNFALGYPVIVGFFPRLQTADGATPLQISTGNRLIDTGNYSPEGSVAWGDQNRPKDMIEGDRLISSVGGALLGLLRAGSVLIRSSRGAEIFTSKLDNLVRIISRNWEHFTEVSSDIVRNFTGRVYRYTGYAQTFAQAKIEDYRLHFYFGDTKAGEAVKSNYRTYSGTPPAMDPVIYKEQITDLNAGSARELMRRTIKLDGEEEIWITNGTIFTRVKSTSQELTLSWNDQNTVTINEDKIHSVHKDGADVILDSAGIRATFQQGNINMSSSSIVTTFNSGTVTQTSSNIVTQIGGSTTTSTSGNITLVNGSGQVLVSPSLTRLSNGARAVSVTSATISLT